MIRSMISLAISLISPAPIADRGAVESAAARSARPRRRTSRHAFALPAVVLMSLLGGMVVAIMLERLRDQNIVVQRQVEGYMEDHFGKGIREVIDTWVSSEANEISENNLDPDGRALDAKVGRDLIVRVYLQDAQGTLLRSGEGFAGMDARAIRQAIADIAASGDGSLLRSVGPAQISIKSVAAPALRAILLALDSKADAQSAANWLEETRAERALADRDFEELGSRAGLDQEKTDMLKRIFVLAPVLWRVDAEVLDARPGRPNDDPMRFTGLTIIKRKGNVAGGSGTQATPGDPAVGYFVSFQRDRGPRVDRALQAERRPRGTAAPKAGGSAAPPAAGPAGRSNAASGSR